MESREVTDSNSCLDVRTLALGTRPSSSPLSPRRPRLLGGAHRAAAASSWPELLFGGGQKGFFKAGSPTASKPSSRLIDALTEEGGQPPRLVV